MEKKGNRGPIMADNGAVIAGSQAVSKSLSIKGYLPRPQWFCAAFGKACPH
jgi:hypothetical protein